MRKWTALVVSMVLAWSFAYPTVLAQESPVGPPELAQIETILYGAPQQGALLARVERAERDVFGTTRDQSALLVRLQNLMAILAGSDGDVPLKMKLNAVEWLLFQKVNEGPSISNRLDQLETALYGETRSSQGLFERLNNLLNVMWPGGRIYVREQTIPKGTLVQIELLTELNSERSRVNDVVRYRVVQDVRLNNSQEIAIPAGALGSGVVTSVNSSGRFGQDGLVTVDWGRVTAMDSALVPLYLDARASERNRSTDLAAGASIAGVLLLGPIGLGAGFFVEGQQHLVPVGTKFYVEVSADTNVKVLSLVPIQQQ